MNIDCIVFVFVGFMVLISIVLSFVVLFWWFVLIGFVGVNLL